MSVIPPSTVEANARALVDLVEDHRARRCESIAGEAAAQASALMRSARANARAIARRAFDEARQRRESRIASASAEVATRHRVTEQHRLRALLEQGMRLLPEALERRWRDPEARAPWVAHVVAEARRRLPEGSWRIEHPADFTAAERERLAHAVASPVEFVRVDGIRAGLRIGAPPNVIDGTLDGILVDRDDVESQLLVAVTRERRAAAAKEPG